MNNEQMNAEIERIETAIKSMNATIAILKGVIELENNSIKTEPKERYFKMIRSWNSNILPKDRIYSESEIKETISNSAIELYPELFQEVSKKEYDKQEERKPFFSFERNDYFEGDKYFYFRKETYKIVTREVDRSTIIAEELIDRSKIYATKELCQEMLNDYIWENHKVTAKEFSLIDNNYLNHDNYNDSFKNYFCEQIIKREEND
jgi:hypothetical protein